MIQVKGKEKNLIRHPLKLRLLQVRRVTKLTPQMVRITLGGEELEGFKSLAPDDHVKLFFPAAGQDKPQLPSVQDNRVVWEEGAQRPAARDFTPRRYDAEKGELDIDFVIHGDGIAANWAANAQIGQWIGVGGPRGSHVVPYEFDWYLLAGDATSLPAIARRLEEMPADSKAIVFIEVADANELQELKTPSNASINWLFRSNGKSNNLEDAVRNLDFPAGEYYAWLSGEANSVRAMFQCLLKEKNADRQHVKINGYWKRGTTNYDHHEPIEVPDTEK